MTLEVNLVRTVQTRNHGGAGVGEAPLENFSPPLEKYVGHNLKVLDIV